MFQVEREFFEKTKHTNPKGSDSLSLPAQKELGWCQFGMNDETDRTRERWD